MQAPEGFCTSGCFFHSEISPLPPHRGFYSHYFQVFWSEAFPSYFSKSSAHWCFHIPIPSFSSSFQPLVLCSMGFPPWLSIKESACSAGDWGSVPGLGGSPGGGFGNPLWCSCLENHMEIGAWWAIVHGIAKSRAQLKRLSMHKLCNILFVSCLLYLCVCVLCAHSAGSLLALLTRDSNTEFKVA